MATYNTTNLNQNQYANRNNRPLYSRILRNLSTYGMNFDEQIARNTVGFGINEDPSAGAYGMYDFFSQRAIASVLSKKSVPYLRSEYKDKKRILREYSIKEEIRDFVTTVADEMIIYDENKFFCELKGLPVEYSEDIRQKYTEAFDNIYHLFGFNDGSLAWTYARNLLIDGYLCFEIVWDDKQKEIISFNPMSPDNIVPGYYPELAANIWIQNPEDPQNRRIFLDSQIIFISYSTQTEFMETSYVEGLIKPFNQLKIIEQTKIMFNILNASLYQMFKIPVGGLSRQRAEEQIAQLIHDYSEQIEWDDQYGTININGSKHLPYNKQLWFPETPEGSPTMELVSPSGHNLNESDMLDYFFKALKRASKIPASRFDNTNGGGSIYMDASEVTRDEQKFANFIGRLRSIFRELITKPLRIQMLIDFPELIEDKNFLNSVGIDFITNDDFEKWKRMSNTSKTIDMISSMIANLQVNEKPYFHPEFLIDKYLKLTDKEKEENKSYWVKYGGNQNQEGGDGMGMDTGGDFGGGGGDTDFSSPPAEGDFGGGDTTTPPPAAGGTEPAAGGGDFEF